jgi:hypothetical protein
MTLVVAPLPDDATRVAEGLVRRIRNYVPHHDCGCWGTDEALIDAIATALRRRDATPLALTERRVIAWLREHSSFDYDAEQVQQITRLATDVALQIRKRAAQACESATLPKGYQWGDDAMESFNFGKKRGATAIRALPIEEPDNG